MARSRPLAGHGGITPEHGEMLASRTRRTIGTEPLRSVLPLVSTLSLDKGGNFYKSGGGTVDAASHGKEKERGFWN